MTKCSICGYGGEERRNLYTCGNDKTQGVVCEGAYNLIKQYRYAVTRCIELIEQNKVAEAIDLLNSIEK
jgi:hypothetical protein